MTGRGTSTYFPLGYYFTKAAAFPTDLPLFEFPTALRTFAEQQALLSSIKPVRVHGLPSAFAAFEVTTYTEYFSPVYAGNVWYNEYVRKSIFTGFLWPDEDLFIAATSREVVRGFVKSARDKSAGRLYLQMLRVNVDALATATARGTRAISLEHNEDTGGPAHVKRLKASGRDVERSPEVQHYRKAGGIGSGLEFNYPYDGQEVPLWVTEDGSIRLNEHVGDRGDPNVLLELAIVADCWKLRVERFHEVRSLPQRVKKVDRPGPVEGQKTLHELLEP